VARCRGASNLSGLFAPQSGDRGAMTNLLQLDQPTSGPLSSVVRREGEGFFSCEERPLVPASPLSTGAGE